MNLDINIAVSSETSKKNDGDPRVASCQNPMTSDVRDQLAVKNFLATVFSLSKGGSTMTNSVGWGG